MATAIIFGGRRINYPGAYSEIDASELAGTSPSATGIVALIGTAVGGKPLSCAPVDADHTRGGTINQRYKSGNLRVAGNFAFSPSLDDAIPNGAQRVVAIKVNPATQAAITLLDGNSDDALTLTTNDYGEGMNQTSVFVEAGTTQGRNYTFEQDGIEEFFEDVGGSTIMSIADVSSAWAAQLITKSTTALVIRGRNTHTGVATSITQTVNEVFSIASVNVGDTTQTVTVTGVATDGETIVQETVALNGTTPVLTTTPMLYLLSVLLSAVAAGNVTVTGVTSTTLKTTVTAGQTTVGRTALTSLNVNATLLLAQDATAPSNNLVIVEGTRTNGGAVVLELVTVENVAVATALFYTVTAIHLGHVLNARTLTVSAIIHSMPFTAYRSIQQVADFINAGTAFYGLEATIVVEGPTRFLTANLDTVTDAMVPENLLADVYTTVQQLSTSVLVTPTAPTGAALLPAVLGSPAFLTGGSEGTTTLTQWQAAFDLLKKRRVNIIVPLSDDPAVHALLVQHLRLRAGQLRSEANGYIGLGASGAGDTRTNIKSRIQVLSTRHISALAQEIKRVDVDTGESTWWPPYMFAVLAAGMQAGSAIGEPLTFKRPYVDDIRQDSSWNPEDDYEEMIDNGLFFAENKDGIGIRVVRSLTTHLADDNVVFTEMSANEATNYATYEFRRRLELKIGKRGLGSTVATIKGLANGVLADLVTDEIIVAYKSLQVEQVGDVFPVSVQMAPVLPVNFIPITVHLVATRIAA